MTNTIKKFINSGTEYEIPSYTAGTWIDITNWVISNTQTSAEWWNITGTLSNQTDLNTALNWKQNTLTSQTAYTSKWTATKVPQITTNSLGQVTGITEVDIQTGETYNAWEGIEIWDFNGRKWPSPDGFHVPSITEWGWLNTIMTSLSLTTWNDWRIKLHMPLAGYRNRSDATLDSQWTYGYYWSSSPSEYFTDYAYSLYFESSSKQNAQFPRAHCVSVRCFKDSYVTPDSSWAVIQWTLWSSWIFWNQSEWLISITDWTNGYTIMDKNLWATAVYNDWDTLSVVNCWNMYQWWNNYWFPSTWTISNTSSTQVDASAYWPTNPYSSDTFIIWSKDWSSVQNDNLWWDTTWVINNVITNTWVLSVNGQTWNVTVASPDMSNYLAKDNTTSFTPSWDYNPATKKYVDDWLSLKANSSSLGTAATKNTWTSSGNVPVLDSNGKLSTSILPALAVTDTFTVTNKSDLTGLTSAEKWDVWIVTSESKTYILSADPYSTAANWKELATPTDAVTSVNSKTGAVTLTTNDISVSNDKNYVSSTEKSTWNWKQNALTAWENISISSNVISANNAYTITDADVTITTTDEYWVSPYSTSYYYTNIEISADAWITWREWAIYTFVCWSTWTTSTYRNCRVRIWSSWDWKPIMNQNNSILGAHSYLTAAQTRMFVYKTTLQSNWALHMNADSTYSAMSASEANTWTATSARSITATVLKWAIQTHAVNDTAYASSWDWVTTQAPSKNAVYDKISAMDTTISGKLDKVTWTASLDRAYIVDTSWNQTTYNVSQWNSSNAIVRRSWTWIIVPDTPWANTHAVNKNYVDAAIAWITAWDMSYSDFNWASKSWATVTLDLASTITPSANFTVNAPSTIKDGQTYILRVNNWSTAYTMTLGTNVTNPYGTDISLTADWIDQFVFLAIGGALELQPEWWGGGWGWITANTTWTTTSISQIWVGTEAEYAALTSYSEDVAYMTY